MSSFINRVGKVYGRLTVIKLAGKNRIGKIQWLCKCSCGNEITVTANSLVSGKTRSCGCLLAETRIESGKKSKVHGCKPKRLYKAWDSMKQRCFNPNCSLYHNYGKRGITVCDDWKEFCNFRDWALSNGYEENLTIDRIDFNGNYCPENCRWVNMLTQENNRRNNIYITYNNETHTLSEWARLFNINYATLYSRLKKYTFEEAISMKSRTGFRAKMDM